MEDAPPGTLSAQALVMSLEWFHAMLGGFFVCVWIIVGQIVATDKH